MQPPSICIATILALDAGIFEHALRILARSWYLQAAALPAAHAGSIALILSIVAAQKFMSPRSASAGSMRSLAHDCPRCPCTILESSTVFMV